ncbi:uncharacterized protein METZ01_LOCUS209310 [marine metagenome]|uniref:Uncharacterized protein n=1 Tax=marine metagenome TaxID=408172 RepID=A0A382F0C5_9ZZZZ
MDSNIGEYGTKRDKDVISLLKYLQSWVVSMISGKIAERRWLKEPTQLQWRVTLPSAKTTLLSLIKRTAQLGCLDDYFLSYAKPRPQNTMNRGSLKSPFSIAVVRVIPKRTANERIPINLHLGSTLFFLNQSSIDIWMISLYTKSNNQ